VTTDERERLAMVAWTAWEPPGPCRAGELHGAIIEAWGRVVDAVLAAAAPRVPAAIAWTFINGHARYHFFDRHEDGLAFVRGLGDPGARLIRIDGPVEWHPAASSTGAPPAQPARPAQP
jgi:hypothetical protein